ncbi:MAG: DUF2927 domain-containing protein [Paracoccaceae bacterium]
MNLYRIVLPVCLMLGACVPSLTPETPTRAFTATNESALPPMKTFSAPRPDRVRQSNRDIARDFLDLTFQLESGRNLPVLTRFEGPISVRVTGNAPVSLSMDLNRVLHRLRSEAGMKIAQTNGETANITIQAVPRSAIRKALPQAACFVVPNITQLSQYASARRTPRTDWGRLRTREQMAIFVPADAAPQEVRDCLHEELAQALGPLNDLYRLPDSVFNDDNVHTVLTGYDMLILRLMYAPELRSGMTRRQVAEVLPALLTRMNPAGEGMAPRRLPTTPRAWVKSIQSALGPGTGPMERRAAAREALSIATVMGWQDHRRAFSLYAMGRLTQPYDPAAAQTYFTQADAIYARTPHTELHRAYVASQMAAFSLSQGDADRTIALVSPHLTTAARHENAALLSTLMLLRAEALDLSGRGVEGRAVRLDSLGWARYGFGADWAVRAKLREIGSLSPLKGRNGRI